MKPRTIDELSEFIRTDLAWRRKETRVIQGLVRACDASKKQAVLRGAVATLYAHWEGFIKTSCRAYLEYVRLRALPYSQLAIPFLSLALKSRLDGFANSGVIDANQEFCFWLLNEWNRRASLPKSQEVVSTSNLNADVFKLLVHGLGLPYRPEYKVAERPVIDALVELRNHLAHGEWQLVDESAYDEFFIWIDRLMSQICDDVEEAALTGRYRRDIAQIG
jgi:hypothetical protein